jgi:transcriptional regulator with XRE-family HTH domain
MCHEALAFGKAVYDQRCALGLTVADLAARADMTVDDVECIEEGGTEPTIALLRRLAAALDSDVRLTPGHDLGSVWFESTQPEVITPAALSGSLDTIVFGCRITSTTPAHACGQDVGPRSL